MGGLGELDDNPQIAVYGKFVTGVDQRGKVRDTCNAGKPVFSGNNSAVDEHAAPALHHSRSKGHHKGHIGIDSIADKNLSPFEIKEIRRLSDDPSSGPD